MNNAQFAKAIKDECKLKGVSVAKMLLECKIRKSLIYDLEKRDFTPSIEIVEKIANYLDCSIDRLVGRIDNENISDNISGNSITTGNISNCSNLDMIIGKKSNVSERQYSKREVEILDMLDELSATDQSKIILMISKLRGES